MSIDEFEFILKEIKPYTDYLYLHIKGEPLIHSDFNDILLLCEKYGFQVNITTNGSLLKKQELILVKPNIRQINISLHSYENNIVFNDLKQIFNTVDNLLINNNNLNIVYRFWALEDGNFTEENLKLIEYLKKFYNLSDEVYKEIQEKQNIKIRERLYINKDTIFEWPNLKSNTYSDIGKCFGTRTHIGILSDGTVIPCCLDSEGCINLGNIFQKKFKDIIESQEFINLNKNIKNGKFITELCKHCSYKNRF